MQAGDVAILDLATPIAFTQTAGQTIHLIIPRIAFPASIAPTHPLAPSAFPRKAPLTNLVGGLLENLGHTGFLMDDAEAGILQAALPDLIAHCLGVPTRLSSPSDSDLGRRLRRHIEENLRSPDLTPARIARDLGLSRSSLYRRCPLPGGIEAYIRRRRLRQCFLALSDPRQIDHRISDIAYEMGFTDEAHFSRLFRKTFGLSPSAVRATLHAEGPRAFLPLPGPIATEEPPSVTETFAHWLANLGGG